MPFFLLSVRTQVQKAQESILLGAQEVLQDGLLLDLLARRYKMDIVLEHQLFHSHGLDTISFLEHLTQTL